MAGSPRAGAAARRRPRLDRRRAEWLHPFRRADERLRRVGSDPDYRFSLANERTFLAYLRTALAFFAAGAAVLTIVDVFDQSVLDAALGAALAVLGIFVSATSYGRWRRNEEAMRRAEPLPYTVVPRVLATALAVVAALSVVAILLLGDSAGQ